MKFADTAARCLLSWSCPCVCCFVSQLLCSKTVIPHGSCMCLHPCAHQVMDTYKEMLRTGCERSVITYSALISACEKAGQWQLALNLFGEMLKEKCDPNVITYNSLITACAQVIWLLMSGQDMLAGVTAALLPVGGITQQPGLLEVCAPAQ
eukprot:GHUV01047165.1.p1 GENE.GHUV01047165.1~~GHUV01047165.1.p1  ORF type:complete len:151 (-),score=31.72 GHUV01047165.1:487-939(-)